MNTPSINTHILLGRVSDEPVLRMTQSGTAKLNFKLTTDRPQPDGRVFKDYHKVVCWGRNAEAFSKDLRENDIVQVTGRVGSRKWEKNDGTVVWITETTVERMAVYKGELAGQDDFIAEPTPSPVQAEKSVFGAEEEIPF